jgi:hypothetical protein
MPHRQPEADRAPGTTPSYELTRLRRIPQTTPPYPRASDARQIQRQSIALLHVPGPRFGRGLPEPLPPRELQARIWANVTQLTDAGAPAPDLILVTGDLMQSARPRERDQALAFLTGLRVLLGLEPDRLLVVPGGHDVSKIACQSYFLQCESRDIHPQPPHFPKLEHYAQLFGELYQGLDGPLLDAAQPWTLFAVPELRVAIAGLNSTMSVTHKPEDDYGWIGEEQATWFAKRLRPFEESGWLRVGIVRHDPGGGPAGSDPDLLRDAGTLDRLLGSRLNLLLHGPGPGSTSVGFLGSGLPVVPAAGPGQEEIIQVTPEGMRRFSAYGASSGMQPRLLERSWVATGATFVSAVTAVSAAVEEPGLGDGAPAPERHAPAPTADPQGLLLERIEEVCATRHERVKIRRVETDPPHLLVTSKEEGFSPQWRVGAHVGELSREVVEEFLRYEPGPGSELVYQGPAPTQALREEALRRGVRLRSFLEFQGLLDLSGYLGRQTTRLRNDPRYPPELYVPQRFRELHRNELAIHNDLADELLRLVLSDYARFVLLLGDFGRGKTFALREVARRIAETTPHLIPTLIELRGLDKAHTVHGLVAAHLANYGEELIDLKAFDYMLREGRIVLLFDGFDELATRLTYDRAAEHLTTLLAAVQGRSKIIVASRTQHFKSDAQVFTALGEQVFTLTQTRRYLVQRYGGDERKADIRLNMIRGIEDLLGLSQNPRMLSFIADLDEGRLRAAADARHTISAAGLYQEILESWLLHEARRVTGATVTLRLSNLWQAVTTLALRLWEAGEPFLRLAQLTEVAQALSSLTEGRLSADQTAYVIGRGSLLVRTEEGLFGFIHSSVTEWLVANMIARQLSSGTAAPPELQRRTLSTLTVDFFCDLANTRACQAWADSALADTDANKVARANALQVSARLGAPPTADLRGASLKGEDFSYRDLRNVDLTGTDLTDARLVGANLSGATLRDARLVGARLDEALLAGADLTGADLTRARLLRTDLIGAAVTGSRWTRAALIDARGVPDAPELSRAAVAPRIPRRNRICPSLNRGTARL